MKSVLVSTAILLLVSACNGEALVTDFNGDSVNIQTSQFAGPEAAVNAQNEANRLCAMRGFVGAEFASVRQDNYNYLNNSLYICTNTPTQTVTRAAGERYM